MTVRFNGGGNPSTRRKPPTYRKILYITCISVMKNSDMGVLYITDISVMKNGDVVVLYIIGIYVMKNGNVGVL